MGTLKVRDDATGSEVMRNIQCSDTGGVRIKQAYRFDYTDLRVSDLQAGVRSFKSLVEGSMDIKQAATVSEILFED